MINMINYLAGGIIPFLIKTSIQILPFFLFVFILSKWVVKHDLKLAYGIWWLLVLKWLFPIKLFTFQREISHRFTDIAFNFSKIHQAPDFAPITHIADTFSFYSIILMIYLFVVSVLLFRFSYKKLSIKRLIIRNLNDQQTIQKIIPKIRCRLNLSKDITIAQITADFACTVGTLNPSILLPNDILEKPKSEIESIILHESIHIKNHDSLTFNVLQILKTVFWFNPLFSIAVKEMLFLQELISDQEVLSTKILDKKTYGMAIINFNRFNKKSALTPNFSKSSKKILKRIEYLNRRNKMKTSLKVFITIGVLAVSLVSFNLSATSTNEKFIFPTKTGRVTSAFGVRMHPFEKVKKHHNGIDIAAPKGTSVFATKSGVVVFAAHKKGHGNTVVIHHNDTKTIYAQLSKILVHKGEKVKQHHIIGKIGSSGISTGPHLHFEIRKNNQPIDPEIHIDFSSL